MYVRIGQDCADNSDVFSTSDNAHVSFVNNTANLAGSSIFFSISMSPSTIRFYLAKVNESTGDSDYYTIPTVKMLGEVISFTASVYDYFNHSSEPVSFYSRCNTCGWDYELSKSIISVAGNLSHELKIFPTSSQDVRGNKSIIIKFTSLLSSFYKELSATLEVQLSPCHSGHQFDRAK